MKLYKTTIVIWSEYDPGKTPAVDLEYLARDACSGESYCSRIESEEIANPENDKDWDNTDFFGDFDDDADEDNLICDRCGSNVNAEEAHLHQGKYICEECWDDRLKMTE